MKLIAVPVSQPYEAKAVTLCTDELSRLDISRLKWDYDANFRPSAFVRSRIHDAIVNNFLCLGATLADPTALREVISARRVHHLHLRLLTSHEARQVVDAVYDSEVTDPCRPVAYRHLAHLIAKYAAGHPRLCVKIVSNCAR